ncbi:hypothetical protein ASPZODRAFT_137259 [Penicilliopsis zonata CBS 506.65]|uniref:RTA1 domain protein n=1 Tax=Penicilliopsis zonata CBS 506.65 TaxID=1073090 RepID=A0A1L9S5K8_9EURO|nr:hypothetical protein ASPZODRAFT_137259 [Penicilliopsis zonata CBS 506.65]OJJ42448.1 hypothetical protein ASPZODRAFT_137259 [Penicilliopsis zonata CBS 506.65]
MIVLPPVLIAAGCYIVFGRILFLVVPREERTLRLCWVPPRFVTPIFVAFDIVALLLQLAGAVMIASTVPGEKDAASKLEHGKHIAQAGVVIQLLAFGLFAVAAIRFNFTSRPYAQTLLERYAADADEKTILIDGKRRRKHWQALLRVVNVTSVLILVRTVYRLVQFSEGKTGYINLHEWTMYVFDAAVVYPCVILFIWWHPAYYLPHLGFSLKD